jgi:hypothetical protein
LVIFQLYSTNNDTFFHIPHILYYNHSKRNEKICVDFVDAYQVVAAVIVVAVVVTIVVAVVIVAAVVVAIVVAVDAVIVVVDLALVATVHQAVHQEDLVADVAVTDLGVGVANINSK